MATITFTIPDGVQARVINSFCSQYGYQAQIPAGPQGALIANPESKAQFFKRKVLEFIKESVKAWEASQAATEARADKETDVNSAIVLS